MKKIRISVRLKTLGPALVIFLLLFINSIGAVSSIQRSKDSIDDLTDIQLVNLKAADSV